MLDSEVYWEVEVMEREQSLKESAVILVVMIVTQPMGFVLLYEYPHTRHKIQYVRCTLLTRYRWRPANRTRSFSICRDQGKNANGLLGFQRK